jgi:protein-glutamine gamma-glutamyltransferase
VNSYLIYRASFYLMLTVATMALSGDTSEARPFQLYPLLVGVAGIIAFLTVDRHSLWALSRPVANFLAAMTVVVLYFEYRLDDSQLIRALGHWLVYLQLIKYFLPKTSVDDWFLFLLGLMQVLIGSVVSQSDRIGLWLFVWAMLAIWVLGQFFLQREACRFLASDERDLRLMSSVDGVSGIPTEGKNLIIVTAVDQVLHFRLFDGDGRRVVDTDEKRLTEQVRQIEDLRNRLEKLWPPHDLTGSEKGQVITTVTSIVGHTFSGSGPMVLRARLVDPYAGLLDLPYVIATARILVTTLALGGLIFLTLPRQAGATRSQAGTPMTKHLTGFDEEVALGQFGEILENDSVVMTVEFTDGDGKTIGPPPEPLWRGVTLVRYETGRWRRQSHKVSQMYVGFAGRGRPQKLLRQKIKLEANDSEALFAIRPIRDAASGPSAAPYLNPMDGTLLRADSRGGAYDYEVLSDPVPGGTQTGEEPPSFVHTELLLSIPEQLKVRLRKITEPIVASIERQGREPTIPRAVELTDEGREKLELARRKRTEDLAFALLEYLRDSGRFSYSLHMDVVNPKLDPVEDFLVNRKEGHCEYFASALALLLRSIDIPSRVVNGFKGGDWNELTQTMNVRQKHAHSWVEAYVGFDADRRPIWITLDPTPSNERAASIAHVGGIAGNFRPLTDLIRHIWVFYIVGYDRDRQNRLLYAPMQQMVGWVRENYNKLVALGKKGFALLFRFEDISAFISWRGGIVTFLGLLLAVGLVLLLYRLGQRVLRWIRGPVVDSASLTAGILFYRRLTQLLAQLELERTPFETQGEFAVRAAKFLTGQGHSPQSVADVPGVVVEAFYRVRFGHLELEPASLEELDARLDALEASMKHD